MAEPGNAVRVLLLARAGEARQRLESALAEAGAKLVAAIDPAEGDAAAMAALAPAAVLVALEPAIEDALERYDALLSDPGVLVMFDEAEVAAQRDGWDAARWVRHLAAKLNGHEDVLPPGAGPDETVLPTPGSLPGREFDPSSIDIGALADTAQDLAAEVPRAGAFDAPGPGPGAAQEAADADTGADAPQQGFAGLVSAEDMDWSASSDIDAASLADDPDLAGLLAAVEGASPGDDAEDGARNDDAARADAAGEGASGDADAPGIGYTIGGDAFTGLELVDDGDDGDDADVAGISGISADASDAGDARDAGDGDSGRVDADSQSPAPDGGIDPLTLGDGLSLADPDSVLPVAGRGADAPRVDLDALASRLDGLSLADPDSYGHGVLRGAVVVEAGLGGPDAVRQLLGGLDEGFARAVLVRLQLDGGRYERLVQQMQRATTLPVRLAEPGDSAEPGTVYFMPPDVGFLVDRARLVFAADADQASGYDALPAQDSAVIFLSGAQAARADAAAALAAAGALVLGQAPATCYDSAAVDALVARGADAAEPGDLAKALIDRWP